MNKFIQLNIDLLWKNLTFCINIFIVCFHSHYDVLITRREIFLKWKRLRRGISTSTQRKRKD